MKLSEIKGERVFDVIAELIVPIANIAADPDASRLFKKERPPKGQDAKDFLIDKVKKSGPVLMKKHKKDVVTILSAIEGVSKKEYSESLTMAKLITDVVELLNDELFISVFISAQRKTGNGSSGSVQENTQDRPAQ